MKRLKEYFNTPKKATCFVGFTVAGLLVLSSVIVIVANIIADKVFIGKSEAKNIALADSGLSASDISNSKVKLDYENGSWEYEVEFYDYNNGKEYDYEIKASDGTILEKDIEYFETGYEHNGH